MSPPLDAIGEEYWFCDCNGTKKSSSSENEEETTEEDSKEERSIFRKVHLARITAHVWAEASGINTVQSRRKVLYAFHKRLKRLLKQWTGLTLSTGKFTTTTTKLATPPLQALITAL